MMFLPAVVSAEYRGGFRIHLKFNDGSEKTVDFHQWLDGPVFEPLKNPDYFQKFFLDGGTVVWPDGADIAPEALYEAKGLGKQPNRRLQPAKARRRTEKAGGSRARLRG